MPLFHVPEYEEATLDSVTNRVEKHGDDDKPAVTIRVTISAANTLLDLIDPKIRQTLYMRKDDGAQADIPGVPESTPVLRCNSFESHELPLKCEGWTVEIDDNIDDTDPMVLGGCKIDKFSIVARQGGSIALTVRIGTSDVDEHKIGKLAMLNKQTIYLRIKHPEKAPDTDEPKPTTPDATDMFVQQGVTVEASRPKTRTARGRAATKKAIADGLAAAGGEPAAE